MSARGNHYRKPRQRMGCGNSPKLSWLLSNPGSRMTQGILTLDQILAGAFFIDEKDRLHTF